MIGQTSLGSLPRLRDYTSHRVSSYDRTGGNMDALIVKGGEKVVLADIAGPGCIKHLWMTMGTPNEDYLRRVVLRIYWEGSSQPSVEAPIGDFFGMGHGIRKNFVSMPLQMSPQNGAGFNSWWPMPFTERCVVEAENQGDKDYWHYFYIDYEIYPTREATEQLAYFHCQWRREEDTKGWAVEEKLAREVYDKDKRINNKSAKDNYIMLEAKGDGIYCGAHLDIDCFKRNPNDWYGEGDDMILIDGEPWPGSLHGTGTEDWYHCAYCPTQEYNAPYHGIILYNGTNKWKWKGKQSVYRYHIEDPLRFRESILVSIEHGHANKLSNDYSSTAYYYLSKPAKAGPKLLPVEKRLPRPEEPKYEPKAARKKK